MKNLLPFVFSLLFLTFSLTSFSQEADSSSTKPSKIKFKKDTYNGVVYISPIEEVEEIRLYTRSGLLVGRFYRRSAIHLNQGYRYYHVEVDGRDGKTYGTSASSSIDFRRRTRIEENSKQYRMQNREYQIQRSEYGRQSAEILY